jgi:hypothetical protein
MARCRTCTREIVWALTEHGKPIPLDPEPRADGNITLHVLGGVDQRVAHVLVDGEVADGPTYVSHFATCPDAETHRRRRERAVA